MHKLKVLICDDAEHVRIAHEDSIFMCGHKLFHPVIEAVASAEDGVRVAREAIEAGSPFDLALLDVDFGQAQGEVSCMDGFEAAEQIHHLSPNVAISMISAYSTDENYRRVESTKYIDRFLRRGSFTDEELKEVCKYALVKSLHAKNALLPPEDVTITQSDVMKDYLDRLDQTPENAGALIYGESGTGKRLAAKRLNANAKVFTGNPNRPLVLVTCGTIEPNLLLGELFGHARGAFTGAVSDKVGWVERADGGDLFIDELQNASQQFQEALLAFIETGEFSRVGETKVKKVNTRIIVALNKEPMKAIRAGTLREDLFGRLQKNYIVIPPLRERKGDIRALIKNFQAGAKADKTFSEDAIEFLESFPWRTNVRGIKAVVEEIMMRSKLPVITRSSLLSLSNIQHAIAEQQRVETDEEPSRPGLTVQSLDERFEEFIGKVAVAALEQGKTFEEIEKDFQKAFFKAAFKQESMPARLARRLALSDTTIRRKLVEAEVMPPPDAADRKKHSG